MDAKTFVENFVEPTIEEFVREPRSPRRAFLACVATFHLLDYIVHPERPGNTRDAFCRESKAFASVDRVAHAFKHVTTGHASNRAIPPLASDDVIERPPAIWGQMVWDLSRWDDSDGGVTIAGEHYRDLLADVKGALLFLKSKLPA